jgi:hypothetical protein
VFYAGVLASDPDGSWQRIANPASTPSIILKEEQNNTQGRNPMPVVCGYYQETGVGSAADDVYANYGTDIDAFSATANTWTNDSPLTVECLARWPATLKYFNWSGPGGQAPNAPDAYLVWQLYPGQGNTIPTGPNAGKFIGLNANWEESRREFDVDVANGWTVPGRANSPWNRPSFAFQDPTTQGRAVSFNFRKVGTWNGDQDRDGVFTTADKFPVRCRLFTNHQAYYNKVVAAGNAGWPNHLADAGGDPATTPIASRNPSYLEGGTYVIDKGAPVYPLIVLDDPNANDPGAPGTVNGQGPGSYTVRLQFLMKFGTANYKIEADTWYTGAWGSNNGVPIVLVKDFATAPNTQGAKDYTINIPAAQPNGNYNFAIRVTDQAAPTPTVATYVWPGVVPLFPSQLFADNFNNLNNWTISTPAGTNAGGGTWYTQTSMQMYSPTTSYVTGQGGTGSYACPSPTSGVNYNPNCNTALTLTNSINVPAGTAFTISFYTAGYSEQSYDGTLAMVSFDGGSTWEGNTSAYWNNQNTTYTRAFTSYNGNPLTTTTAYGFGGTLSTTGAGASWVSHSKSYAASGVARNMKIRFWWGADSSVQYRPGICVDTLLVQ